jgi:hypothetical protein
MPGEGLVPVPHAGSQQQRPYRFVRIVRFSKRLSRIESVATHFPRFAADKRETPLFRSVNRQPDTNTATNRPLKSRHAAARRGGAARSQFIRDENSAIARAASRLPVERCAAPLPGQHAEILRSIAGPGHADALGSQPMAQEFAHGGCARGHAAQEAPVIDRRELFFREHDLQSLFSRQTTQAVLRCSIARAPENGGSGEGITYSFCYSSGRS